MMVGVVHIPGWIKAEFVRRAYDSWAELADVLAVPPWERHRWARGAEARELWDWLDVRHRLDELPGACRLAGRPDRAGLLTGPRPTGDPRHAAAELAEALGDQPTLLVVDDVWTTGQLAPFLIGAPSCVRLITTRNALSLPRGTRAVPVEAMLPGEARDLLLHNVPAPTSPEPVAGRAVSGLRVDGALTDVTWPDPVATVAAVGSSGVELFRLVS